MMEDETTDHGIEGLICEGQLLHWLDPKINRHVTALSFVTSARDHLRSGINARDQPGRTDPSIDLLGEITGSAPDIEHRLSWSQLRQVGGARVAVVIDIGFGDAIEPGLEEVEILVLLDHPAPRPARLCARPSSPRSFRPW